MEVKDIILNTIIADTLGRPLVSMSSGHIKSTIKNIETYINSEKALKDKLEKWVKPGLYSSISQFIILIGMSFTRKKFNKQKFYNALKNIPEVENKISGIFRNADNIEEMLLINCKNGNIPENSSDIQTAKIVPFVIPCSLVSNNDEQCIYNSIEILSLFSKNISTISAGIIFSLLIYSLTNNKKTNLIQLQDLSIECCNKILQIINQKPQNIFNMALNPDSLLNDIEKYKNIFKQVESSKNPRQAEEIICNLYNNLYKNSVKRANLNIPQILLPYTVYLTHYYSNDPSSALMNIIYEGGQTSTLLSMAGALIACIHGTSYTPASLKNELINKNKLILLLDKILTKDFSEKQIAEYIESEKMLTIKEEEELSAKLKHYHKKNKKGKSKSDQQNELTKHVVESWTKIDKAKWKKQRKKIIK